MRARLRVAFVVVLSSVGGLLALAVESPARTINVPRTIARASQLTATSGGGRVHLSVPPTHVAFSWRGQEGTGVRYRTLTEGGEASGWRRATEAHDLEHGNTHYSAVIAVDRPDSIDWRPVRPSGKWMGKVTLDSLNTLDGEKREVEIQETAYATVGAPNIVTRAQWGADESIKRTSGGCKRSFFKVQQLFVHHTAGSNSDSNFKATMRAMYWYHAVRRGWCDLGYNFVVARNGTIFEGRWARGYRPWELHNSEDLKGRAVSGAHVSGYNSGSVGVSLMGNFETAPLPPSMRRSVAELLAWEVDRHDLRPRGTHTYRNPETGLRRKLPYIAGHRDAGQTSCPGRYLYAALPGIRRDAKAVIGAGKANSSLTFTPSPVKIGYGDTANLAGTLTDTSGAPLASKTIVLYRKTGAESWGVHSQVATAVDGSFSFAVTPTAKMTLFAVYDGDSTTWGASSGKVVVRVSPDIAFAPEGAVPDQTGVYRFPAGTTSVSLGGTLVPPHSGRKMVVKVRRAVGDGTYEQLVSVKVTLDSQGVYRYVFTVPEGFGVFRATAQFPKDSDHAFGRSLPVDFTVG
jgi:hypothetical protein